MKYRDIIRKANAVNTNNKWWCDFLYHFSDVHNIVGILADGVIYGRRLVINKSKMKSDNASRAVINVTSEETKEYARLYFRPKTPTQYHNEGYKPLAVRNKEINANCPVPVFLCLDMEEVLEQPEVFFVEKGMAGAGHALLQGIEEFEKLDFRKIYHSSYYDKSVEADIKEYRQSEVVKKGGISVEPYLKCILCRSVAEKDTLLYLLKKNSIDLYNRYKGIIMYRPKLDCFYKNGIFIEDVSWNRERILIALNDKAYRATTGDSTAITVSIDVHQCDKNNNIISINTYVGEYDYGTIEELFINLDLLNKVEYLTIKVKFDDCIMYENELDVREMAVF